jgi:RND family efflux transporter MFP subunit
MTDDLRSNEDQRRRRWAAWGGTAAFVVLGLLLGPGLARLRETPSDTPGLEGRNAEPPPISVEGPLSSVLPLSEPGSPESGGDGDFAERSFDCMIAPNEVIEIGSPVTGVIEEMAVERSDTVEAGDVLVRLEANVETAAVHVAQARAEREVDIQASAASLDLDRKRQARAERLYEGNALSLDRRQEVEAEAKLSGIELERAREDQRLAALQLEQARAALERRTIRSPVSGIVVDRLMAPGEVVDDETVLRVAQVDPLRVEAIPPSSWFGQLERGDRAEIVPEPPHDQPRTAEVAIVDRIIDGASGTFGVQLRLANPDHELPAGLRCTVRFSSGERLSAKRR